MPEPNETSPKPKPKRRWLRRLGWSFIALGGLAMAINGPIARWSAENILNTTLEEQGMQGSAQVEGTLANGFTIRNLSYSGNQGIQQLDTDEIKVEYTLLELMDGTIRGIKISDAKVVIDTASFPPSKEDPDNPHATLKETLASIRPWVIQPEITVEQLDVTLLKEQKTQARFHVDSLEHPANSSDFIFSGFLAADNGGRTTPKQETHLTWLEFSAEIDQLEILPDIQLESLAVDWKQSLKGRSLLHLYEAELDLSITDTISAKILNGTLSTDQVTDNLGIALPFTANITQLDAKVSNWQDTNIPEWTIDAHIEAGTVKYEDYQLENLSLRLTQSAEEYKLAVDGKLNGSELTIQTSGKWTDPEHKEWWRHTDIDLAASTPRLGNLPNTWITAPEGLHLENSKIHAQVSASIQGEAISNVSFTSQIEGIKAQKTSIPAFSLSGTYDLDRNLHVNLISGDRLQLQADYNIESQEYRGDLTIDEKDPQWINAAISLLDKQATIHSPLKLSWQGKGNLDLKKPQTGSLKLDELHLALPEMSNITASTQLTYNWPESLTIESLKASESDWSTSVKLNWSDDLITIDHIKLNRDETPLASITGKVPYQSDIKKLQQFLQQDKEWSLKVDSKQIAINKLRQWFSIDQLDGFNGELEANLTLAGKPSSPEIRGNLSILNFVGLDNEHLAPLNLSTRFQSEDELLKLNTRILERDAERLTITGTFPFTPDAWINEPNLLEKLLNKSPINAKVNLHEVPLGRLKKFFSKLESIEGNISGEATITGTIHAPKYTADIHTEIPVLKIGIDEVRDARNLQLKAQITEDMIADINATAQINGGEFKVGGKVDFNETKNPSFDIDLKTQYALIHRDDLLSARANTNLNFKGTLEDATISGRIGLVESLLYKDIEVIPIGVPSSTVAEVQLPVIDPEKAETGLPIPEPFDTWKLNLTAFTQDPILARGNIASGYARGSIQIGGTLKKPEPSGVLEIRNVKAKLPFSVLDIRRGTLTFTPQGGIIPLLDIRGRSSIGSYEVNVFVYGSAAAPKTTFTSYPPLPESEVMALIATGSTTSDLENQQVAAFKAFQIFLIKMRQRAEAPGGNELFAALLKGMENLNLNVGDKNAFTGKDYYSATIELHPRWHLTAQIDDEQQTRGLIVYVIRFR